MSHLPGLQQAVIEGNYKTAETLTRQALDEGMSALGIFQQGLVQAMDIVGQKMRSGEYYLPEVLISVRAMKAASELLRPVLAQSGGSGRAGTVVIGTVQGDLHDIGKNLVGMMLEGAGFQVVDLGIDVSAERFLQALEESGASVLGMSALLTTTMVGMRDVIQALNRAGKRNSVKVMIGGAPVGQRFCEEVGADGTARDAVGAVELAKKFMGAA